MSDLQDQPESRGLVEVRNARPRPGATAPVPRIGDRLSIQASALDPADRRTWEDFWSNLLGEYKHLGVDLAKAA